MKPRGFFYIPYTSLQVHKLIIKQAVILGFKTLKKIVLLIFFY